MSANYSFGLATLKDIYRQLATKPMTEAEFIESLKLSDSQDYMMPESDFVEWVDSFGSRAKMFDTIVWIGDNPLKKLTKRLAALTPKGQVPKRRMIDSAMLNPETFVASTWFPNLAAYYNLTKKASVQAVQQVAGNFQWIAVAAVLAGGVGLYFTLKGRAGKVLKVLDKSLEKMS